jgi:hypothetical protein
MRRVALGEHGIVEVARILAVDRDQRHLAQVEAVAQRRRLGAARPRARRPREFDRDVVGAIEIRLMVRGSLIGPIRSITRRLARQVRAGLLDPDDVAWPRSLLVGGSHVELAPSLRSVGVTRPRPPRPGGSSYRPRIFFGPLPRRRITRAGRCSCRAASARRGRDRRRQGRRPPREAVRIDLDARRRAVLLSSWRRGTASRWPSSSTRTISNTVMSVSALGSLNVLARSAAISPTSRRSRSSCFSSMRWSPFRPKARAISRLPTGVALSLMNASSSSRVGTRPLAIGSGAPRGLGLRLALGRGLLLGVVAAAFGVSPTSLAATGGVFLARTGRGFLPPFAARSASSDTACSTVSSSGLRSRGTVAFRPPCLTYMP